MTVKRLHFRPHRLEHSDQLLCLKAQGFIQRGMEQCGLSYQAHCRFKMRYCLTQEYRRVFDFG